MKFEYDTDQHVKSNLQTVLFLVLVTDAALLLFVGPDSWREPFLPLVTPPLDASKLESLVKVIGGLLVVPSVLALIAIEAFDIHDAAYDRYVVRWRERFDVDFVLARLYMPFAERVDRRFMVVAEQHTRDFMERLFYEFVRDLQPKIPAILVRRFWESATWYWVTQLIEMVLILNIGILLLLLSVIELTSDEIGRMHRGLLGLFLLLLVNRIWTRQSRTSVRLRTAEEIRAIVTGHKPELQQRLKALADEHSIPNQL